MKFFTLCAATTLLTGALTLDAADAGKFEYKLLATTKTSTMEKELNEAAAEGFAFSSVMGGQTGTGGSEVVVVMSHKPGASKKSYKLLGNSTCPLDFSTMIKVN